MGNFLSSLTGAAAGATPWGAIGQTAVGLAQTIGGFIQNKRATKALEKMQSPIYNQNQSVLDYYSKALQRYNVNPQSTDLYKMQNNAIQRNLATGISALGDRRSALAGVGKLVQGADDAALKANVAAENEQGQRFGQLQGATNMKAGEDRMAFQVNQQDPFERKYNLLAMKASGGSQIGNAGISNIFGGLQSAGEASMLNKMYGGTSNNSGGSFGTLNPSDVLRDLYRNQNRRVGTSRNVQIGG